MVASDSPALRQAVPPAPEGVTIATTADVAEPKAASTKKPGSKKPILYGVLAVAVLAGGVRWFMVRGQESTDDAAIDAEVVAVSARVGGTVAKNFFVDNQTVKEGDTLAVLDDALAKAKVAQMEAALAVAVAGAEGADVEVRLTGINARGNKDSSNAAVQTASVGAASAADQIKEAEASIRTAEANVAQADNDLSRAKTLVQSGAYSQSQLDQAQTSANVAHSTLEASRARLATLKSSAAQAANRVVEAHVRAEQSSDVNVVISQAEARAKSKHAEVEAAKAALELAKLELSYTVIKAPHDGVVSKKMIAEGQSIGAGQTLVQLVTPAVWVTANFKETQVAKMHAHQPAEFDVDAFPGMNFKGEVESFSGATGSRFTLLPPDNASGNFTKVVQRVPVRIKVTEVPQGITLRPGMSVNLTVNTR